MSRESNTELIRDLERQIDEGEGDAIKLKRARNSLLNISTRIPPEILGEIFSWILFRGGSTSDLDSHFDGLRKGSFNFLLVCHHWFQVASRTPELWSFWGNTLREWRKHHHRPRVTPLDLVLKQSLSDPDNTIDDSLVNALRDCAIRDNIRQVHLLCNGVVLSSIISALTPEGEDIGEKSVESIDFLTLTTSGSHVANFFARMHLPKLRSLRLRGVLVMPWDHFAQLTTSLTTLSLSICSESPLSAPSTTSQLFSILASNPGLQVLSLDGLAIPEDDDDRSTPQVTLSGLKKLYLRGQSRRIFGILDRLVTPQPLDHIDLIALHSTVEDVPQTLGSYLQHYFCRDRRLRGKLRISAYATTTHVSINVETERETLNYNPFLARFLVTLTQSASKGVTKALCHDLVASIPRGQTCHFETNIPTNRLEDLLVAMSNVETLSLSEVEVSEGFLRPSPDGPHAGTKLLPSLRFLRLDHVTLSNNDWGYLTAYLDHQTSDGQAISFMIASSNLSISPEVERKIEGLVEKLICRLPPTQVYY